MEFSKSVFALLIFLPVLIASISFISPVKAVTYVEILSHTGWLDAFGFYTVVGEVQNVRDQAVDCVEIPVTFYNSSDVVIATKFAYTSLDVLLVGRKSPFGSIIYNTTQSAQVHHYILGEIQFRPTSPFPMGLEILSNSSYVDDFGWMHVIGEIKNIGEQRTRDVEVVATAYDEAGSVVDYGETASDPVELDPNQTAQFDLVLATEERVPLVASYVVTAESNEYAIISEFPAWALVPLILIVLTVATAIYKRRILKTPVY